MAKIAHIHYNAICDLRAVRIARIHSLFFAQRAKIATAQGNALGQVMILILLPEGQQQQKGAHRVNYNVNYIVCAHNPVGFCAHFIQTNFAFKINDTINTINILLHNAVCNAVYAGFGKILLHNYLQIGNNKSAP